METVFRRPTLGERARQQRLSCSRPGSWLDSYRESPPASKSGFPCARSSGAIGDRASSLPTGADPGSFSSSEYIFQLTVRMTRCAVLYHRLHRIFLRVRKDPKRSGHKDLALTPVTDHRRGTIRRCSHNAAAQTFQNASSGGSMFASRQRKRSTGILPVRRMSGVPPVLLSIRRSRKMPDSPTGETPVLTSRAALYRFEGTAGDCVRGFPNARTQWGAQAASLHFVAACR